MTPLQSPHVPPPGRRPSLSDAGWLIVYGVNALVRLTRARLAFARFEARDIVRRNSQATMAAQNMDAVVDEALVARIAYIVPRIAARLPWRSDCLIQTMAAQDWLAEHGLASEIRVGVERPADGKFGAHAWLVHRDVIVTGGDVARYDVLIDSGGKGSLDA